MEGCQTHRFIERFPEEPHAGLSANISLRFVGTPTEGFVVAIDVI